MTPSPCGHLRRTVDVVLAFAGLAILTPVVLVVALLVRWRLGTPVLFRQRRSGLHGTEFTILKFRTMRPRRYHGQPDAERTTGLGAVLRGLGLDEVPQLVNILRGDMSVIGPRPTLPDQVRRYSPRQRGRLLVRPGLTGWAQVCGRNALSWPARIELDLWYIENRSLAVDLRIILLTAVAVLRRRGVVGEGGVNPDFPPVAG